MHEKLWSFIGAPQCANCNTRELMANPLLFSEALVVKTECIGKAGLGATSLLPDVYLLRDLVRDVLAGRYPDLSFLAFAHVCVALDYFITAMDACHDDQVGGLLDDIEVINRTKQRFSGEIEAYQRWARLGGAVTPGV